jgi:hypothetical protein
MPKPYSNCDIENDESAYLSEVFLKSDLYKIIWHSPLDYSQQLCLDICLQQRIGQACNCTPSDKYSLLPQYAPCKTNDACATNMSRQFSTNEFIRANCLHLCPLQCNRTLYPTSISSSMLIGSYYIDKVAGNARLREDFVTREINDENVKNSVVRVYIFYESLSYTESVEVVIKPSTLSLAANIGGILSLFLGVSVMSLFEVCEIFIELYLVR